MAKKTIAELFKKAPNTVFYIGAESGFFFIGNAKRWEKYSKKINGKCRDLHDSKQLAAHKNLPRILNDVVALVNNPEKLNKNACGMVVGRLAKTLDNIATPWVDIWDRTPIEICEKELEQGYAIKVEGLEEGKFWTKDEFDSVYGGWK